MWMIVVVLLSTHTQYVMDQLTFRTQEECERQVAHALASQEFRLLVSSAYCVWRPPS